MIRNDVRSSPWHLGSLNESFKKRPNGSFLSASAALVLTAFS